MRTFLTKSNPFYYNAHLCPHNKPQVGAFLTITVYPIPHVFKINLPHYLLPMRPLHTEALILYFLNVPQSLRCLYYSC
ncbi:hypothetical protein CW304_19310 [Bacillus sp. UFRGS-B20]|nr:hypothetical protein CW304_19310 [Bacillus sp. UFRGS-B20]